MPDEKELHDILNYTFVAVVGMIAGFIVGYLYGQGLRPAPSVGTTPAAQSR
jgi:hypothetical protein